MKKYCKVFQKVETTNRQYEWIGQDNLKKYLGKNTSFKIS